MVSMPIRNRIVPASMLALALADMCIRGVATAKVKSTPIACVRVLARSSLVMFVSAIVFIFSFFRVLQCCFFLISSAKLLLFYGVRK